MKILTVVGARPQFIKAAMMSRQFKKHRKCQEILVHTGQHFDWNMSEVFFRQLGLPRPSHFLKINRLPHGAMTGRMMERLERIYMKEKPDWVLVYGDTNSTLAGALAARKQNIRVAHVEAGLRCGCHEMPEETNRILTDRLSYLLFCPTTSAMRNLKQEGFGRFDCRFVNAGDVMLDASLAFSAFATKPNFSIPDRFVLATLHRAENTNEQKKLDGIVMAMNRIAREIPVVLPLHPRTKAVFPKKEYHPDFLITKPVGYFEMLYLLQRATLVMTDSGGLQKEAYFFKKPCVLLRQETEWQELVQYGYSQLAGSHPRNIWSTFQEMKKEKWRESKPLFGQGNASSIMVKELLSCA